MKLKGKMVISVLVIALAAALIGGGIMAWFTNSAAIEGISFAAGTVDLEADQKASLGETEFTNVNPGDKYCVGWEITNTGSKGMALRLVASRGWNFALGELNDPAHIAICPNYQDDWKIVPTEDGFEVYYVGNDGRIEPEDTVTLVLVVAFEGLGMGNDFQGATFALSGDFEAIQTTNGAPLAEWGENWEAGNQPDEYFADFTAGDWPECCGQEQGEPEPQTYMVTVTVDDPNGGSVTGGGEYEVGEEVTLNATANEGYTFVGWEVDGAPAGSNNPYTFTMPAANVTVKALFEAEVITYCTVSFDPDHENGQVHDSMGDHKGVYQVTVPKGGTVNPLPTASRPGNHPFAEWRTTGGVVFTTSTPVTGNITVYAHYN